MNRSDGLRPPDNSEELRNDLSMVSECCNPGEFIHLRRALPL
jgi:hypothetical protein